MVAIGFAAKDLLRWQKDGRLVHIFTDPSTSPRTELGRLIFGALYGLSTVALYALLARASVPTFYDKLLQVPILNLCIQLIDRAARSNYLRPFDPAAIGRRLAPRQRHLAYIAIWALIFTGLSATHGLGDDHPGQWLPFWQKACAEERPSACVYLAAMHANFCRSGSEWACNELAILQGERIAFERRPPAVADLQIVLRGSKGAITERNPAALYARACAQGWREMCP